MAKKKERTLADMLAKRTTYSSQARLLAKHAPEDRERRFKTERGKRRLSFEEAYGRRTTDASRQRVVDLYGKKAPPSAMAQGAYRAVKPSPARPTGANPVSTKTEIAEMIKKYLRQS